MKCYYVVRLSLISIGITILFYACQNKKAEPIQLPLFYDTPASNGSNENPHARSDWEAMRLKDPHTGNIPAGMRKKELAFVKSLPSDNVYNKMPAYEWTAMGPYNAAGRTRAVAIDVTNENIILSGGVSGGLWRTTDGGSSWAKVTTLEQHHSITTITQDTRAGKTNIWYYGSGEGGGNSAMAAGAFYFGNGVYKSTDGGMTWNSLASTVSGTPEKYDALWDVIWRVITSPVDTEDVVYVATIGAIYKSSNGGIDWTKELGGNLNNFAYYTDIAITSTGILYSTISSDGPGKGIWRSEDGDNWTNITPSNWSNTYNRIVIGITPTDEDIVYFLANTPNSGQMTTYFDREEWNSLWKYSYLSGNGSGTGGNWMDLSTNLPSNNKEFDNFNTQSSYDMVVKVKPDAPNTVFIGGVNLFRSTDGFTTANNITRVAGWLDSTSKPHYEFYPNQFVDHHELIFQPSNPDVVISANDAGLFKTLDCSADKVTWTSLNNGYLTTQFYTIAIDHGNNNSNVIIGGLQDIGNWLTNSSNPKAPWAMPTVGDGAYCAITDGGDYYYFSRQLGQIVKTKLDAQGIPTIFTRIDPSGANDYLFINPFILDPVDNNVMYLAEGTKLWRNDDLSEIVLDNKYDTISTNWFRYSDTISVSNVVITALAVSTIPAHRLYYGTSNRRVYRMDNANAGNPTPIEITSNKFPGGAYVSCLAVDPKSADKVMVVFSNYNVYSLFYSQDGGSNWGKVAGNLEQNSDGSGNGPSCRWATILPTDSSTFYFVATSTGLYATDTLNSDSTIWVQQGANIIGNVVVDMIDARSSDGFIAIGTHGNGVYATNIPEEKDAEISSVVQLNVYPNPVNNYTTIEINIPAKEQVSLTLYDNLGKKVAIILDNEMNAGKYTIQYNVEKIYSGLYYLSLSTNNYRKTKKMIVRK